MDYLSFLKEKEILWDGQPIPTSYEPHPAVFPFQVKIIEWAISKGRAAIFADTGLGKTIMQVELARTISDYTEKPVLIVAPLGVAQQTVQQANDILDYRICYAKSQDDVLFPVATTNYERLNNFEPNRFGAIILDESSILKSIAGKTKQKLIDNWAGVKYRFAFTATPAPNDIAELANHTAFLGIMSREEMLAKFFTHDGNGYRITKWAEHAGQFYKWVASWSISLKKPSDIGDFSDEGYNLPQLEIIPVIVDAEYKDDSTTGQKTMIFTGLKGITSRAKIRKMTQDAKVAKAIEIINDNPDDQFIAWSWFNDEADKLERGIDGSCQVAGRHKPEDKLNRFNDFVDGSCRVLVTKPKIAGMGLNFQHSNKAVLCGINDSYEMFYQLIRRQWRFGQQKKVTIYVIFSEFEQAIFENIKKKGEKAEKMSSQLISDVQKVTLNNERDLGHNFDYQIRDNKGVFHGNDFHLMNGDSCERMGEIENNSIDMSVYSPPFDSLYTYSPTARDLGNSKSSEDFYNHYKFIVEELLRVTKPGRVTAVHVADIPAMLSRDGYIGLKDFSGDVIRLYIECGWIFDGRIAIDKNQQAQSIRTHSKALTMTSMEKDRSWIRPALPDYILKFRKPGVNDVLINSDEVTRDMWIELANPIWPSENGDRAEDSGLTGVWYGIDEADTLQGFKKARDNKDERHVCPLQLGTIERCIKLWSNPGETVFTPFMGVGSEVYQALKMGRNAIGIELKPSYYQFAVKNMATLEVIESQTSFL